MVTATEVIMLGIEITKILIQIFNTVKPAYPQIKEILAQWEKLADDFLNGEEVTEQDVERIRQAVYALSEENAELEDAIINGTV